MIEAVAPKRSDDSLAVRVGSRRSRRRKELSNPEAVDPTSKSGAINAIPIVQEEAWRQAVADRFDHALGCPLGRRIRGDADVHDLEAFEREDYEAVEHLEAETHDGEEVASPDLREVIAHERRPGLTAAAVEVPWSILGDGTR